VVKKSPGEVAKAEDVGADWMSCLARLFEVVMQQARDDPGFAARIQSALRTQGVPGDGRSESPAHVEAAKSVSRDVPPRTGARAPRTAAKADPPPRPEPRVEKAAPVRRRALIDPFALYDAGWEEMLRSHLVRLDVEQLRDVIAQYALDPQARTERESDADRLRDWIVRAVEDIGSNL